jgi:hypothetical protein
MADIYDPSSGVAPPSDDLTDPGKPAPGPKAFPIKKMGQIRMSGWTIYAEGEKLYAKSPSGVKAQFVLYDPAGLTEEAKPNKVSDGSDGSKDSKGLTENTSTGSTTSSTTTSTDTPQSPTPASDIVAVSIVDEIAEEFAVEVANIEDAVVIWEEGLDVTTMEDIAQPVQIADDQVVEISNDNVYDTTPNFKPESFAKSLQVFTGTKPSGTYTGTYFLNQDETAKPFADAFLGRTLESEEWDDLISAVASESRGNSSLERAWIMGTILNRSRKSGLLVGQVILDVKQFTTIGPNPSNKFREGPNDAADSIISSAARQLVSVLKNNYYYSKLSSGRVIKNGVVGIPIGNILVFPGARWP